MDARSLMAEVTQQRRDRGWSIGKTCMEMGISVSSYVQAQGGRRMGLYLLACIRRTFPDLQASVDRFLVDFRAQ